MPVSKDDIVEQNFRITNNNAIDMQLICNLANVCVCAVRFMA